MSIEDYEPVASRLARFWEKHPEGRVITKLITFEGDRVIVQADSLVSTGKMIDPLQPTLQKRYAGLTTSTRQAISRTQRHPQLDARSLTVPLPRQPTGQSVRRAKRCRKWKNVGRHPHHRAVQPCLREAAEHDPRRMQVNGSHSSERNTRLDKTRSVIIH